MVVQNPISENIFQAMFVCMFASYKHYYRSYILA